MKTTIGPIVSGILMLVSSVAGAQVGYFPASSPYVDLEHAQEISLVVGEFHAHRDPVNVGPQSGMLVGAHYEWRVSGPAHFIADVSRISSDRRLINPLALGTARDLGTVSRPLYAANLGLGMSLTGAKSWHRIVPEVAGGLGFVSDLRSRPDTGGFKFGTRFALVFGTGIRWVPGGAWQVRGDLTDRLYTIGYPETFYTTPAGGTPLIQQSQAKSFWTHNPALTLGLSRLF